MVDGKHPAGDIPEEDLSLYECLRIPGYVRLANLIFE
jgi:hypothetical protein